MAGGEEAAATSVILLGTIFVLLVRTAFYLRCRPACVTVLAVSQDSFGTVGSHGLFYILVAVMHVCSLLKYSWDNILWQQFYFPP